MGISLLEKIVMEVQKMKNRRPNFFFLSQKLALTFTMK